MVPSRLVGAAVPRRKQLHFSGCAWEDSVMSTVFSQKVRGP